MENQLQQFATGAVRVGQLAVVDQFAHYPQGFLLVHPFSPTVVLTAKTAGYYQIEGTVSTAANAIVLAEIRLNGTTIIAQAGTGNTGAATQGISLSTTYNLSVNDYVEFLGYFGSTQNTQSGLGGTHFTAYKIG